MTNISGVQHGGYLMAYFTGEHEGGEQVSFAVSSGSRPNVWTPLNDCLPALVSDVGECGLRDPFLLRDEARERFVLLATDLRIWPTQDWARSVRRGSRSLVVCESEDLLTWTTPRLVRVSPAESGNTWAPKAFWSPDREAWLVLWASALYGHEDSRVTEAHQRMMCAWTTDFATFTDSEVYLDAGHTVIDMTFLALPDGLLRFSKHSMSGRDSRGIVVERGSTMFGDFDVVEERVGLPWLTHAEGPAPILAADGEAYVILDEHGLRGCALFTSTAPLSGTWEPVADAYLPPGSRHCSVLAISEEELSRLVSG